MSGPGPGPGHDPDPEPGPGCKRPKRGPIKELRGAVRASRFSSPDAGISNFGSAQKILPLKI